MRSDPNWIVIDLCGPPDADLMVHSVGGVPCQRTLRRAVKAGALDLDREAVEQISSYVRGLDVNIVDQHVEMSDRHIAHHVVTHTERGPVSVAVWIHETPPADRPVLNSWVLDLAELTTVTAGDDASIMADGRTEGEERPIQDLWRFLNPADAAVLVSRYQEASAGIDRAWLGIEWSLGIPDLDPVHMFSGGRLLVEGEQRTIVGTSVVLTERTEKPRDLLGPLVAFAGITLTIVNREAKTAVTSVGADAPLSYAALRDLVTLHDLYTEETFAIDLDGIAFDARVVPIAAPDGGAATVMLRRRKTT